MTRKRARDGTGKLSSYVTFRVLDWIIASQDAGSRHTYPSAASFTVQQVARRTRRMRIARIMDVSKCLSSHHAHSTGDAYMHWPGHKHDYNWTQHRRVVDCCEVEHRGASNGAYSVVSASPDCIYEQSCVAALDHGKQRIISEWPCRSVW